ncbi:MAG: FkbM family methyltransferase [Pseudomonadales bacterium]
MIYKSNEKLNELIKIISRIPLDFGISSAVYQQWAEIIPSIIQKMYQQDNDGKFELELFGKIQLPYVSFGNINSAHLFGLDEIILFVFYWNNRDRYQEVFDLGANIGLHTIMMSKCGFKVNSFEPDPKHIDILQANLDRNQCEMATIHRSAVYSDNEEKEFIRVVGNTTGSHLAGMKENPYGELDTFKVKCTTFNSILAKRPSLIKMDIEGAEADVICSTKKDEWLATDMLLEVGTEVNAKRIWNHLSSLGVNMFAQKCGWQAARSVENVPVSYKEGSLFISMKDEMPW